MPDLPNYLAELATFLPGNNTLSRRPELAAMHVVSDAVIALSYLAIPAAILTFLYKRPDITGTSRKIAQLFVAFILACAATHMIAVTTLWVPTYGLEGMVKLITSVISILAAVVVWQTLPKLLTIPSLQELKNANEHLKAENLHLNTEVGRSQSELNRINDRFEKALTGSNISVFSQNSDLRYTWIHNPRFGFTPDEVIGKTDQDVLDKETADEVSHLKQQVMESGETSSTYIAIENEEAGAVFLDLIVHPTRNCLGEIDGVLCTAVDMTEKNLYEIRLASMASQLAEANKRFEQALAGSLITVFEQDRDLTYVHVVNPPKGLGADHFVGKADHELFSEEDCLKLIPAKQHVIASGESSVLEVDIDINGLQKNYNVRLDPSVDRDGKVSGVIGTAVDLTHKRDSERQMHLVMRELTHRSKNLLAVIQAMARQTAAKSDTTEEFVESFSARLQAMAASHDLLVSQSWYGADLRELVITHLGQSIDPGSSQIEILGDVFSITADAAQNMGLALHELTTNAAKYGALSVLEGQLKVSWERVGNNLKLVWEESGGPHVVQPERKGFGSVLLTQLVGPALDGEVMVEFRPSGLRCVIEFPIRHLTQS